jgi:hypothetical protein
MSRVVAIVLNAEERSYLLRLLQHELREHDEPLVADLLKMLEDAVDPYLVASLERE